MGRALGNIALHLSKCRITSCLVILLMTPSSIAFGQDPTPGKYSCSIANIVGLPTDSQTGSRNAGSIAERQQTFFVTIEDNKQQPEDWCFGAEALDNLKKLRRGEKPDAKSKTFLEPWMFFTACQARFRLSTNGGPVDGLYHSDNLAIFRDEFSQFWLRNGLNYIWQFVDLKANAYLAEGRCQKVK